MNDENTKHYPKNHAGNAAINNMIKNNYRNFCIFSIIYIFHIIAIIAIYGYLWQYSNSLETKDPPLSFFAIVLGGLGAYSQMLVFHHRSADFCKIDDCTALLPEKSILKLSCAFMTPITIGAISGFVIYTILSGGIIEGALFPKFMCKQHSSSDDLSAQCKTFLSVIRYWTPSDAQSYVKVFLWSYIAGFYQDYLASFLSRFSLKSE